MDQPPRSDHSKIAVQGLLQAGTDTIMDVTSFRVRDGSLNDENVTDLVCTRKKATLTCSCKTTDMVFSTAVTPQREPKTRHAGSAR